MSYFFPEANVSMLPLREWWKAGGWLDRYEHGANGFLQLGPVWATFIVAQDTLPFGTRIRFNRNTVYLYLGRMCVGAGLTGWGSCECDECRV